MSCLPTDLRQAKTKSATSNSEHRRLNKPIMERKRRQRINRCLDDLKNLLLDSVNKDPTRNSKLEKADILEMTVRHLQDLERKRMAADVSRDPTVISKYRAGFSECASEVNRFVNKIDGMDQTLKSRLINHLNSCLSSIPAPANGATGVAFPGMSFATGQGPLQVHIPAGHSLFPSPSPTTSSAVNLSTASDINNNTRRSECESKLTPASASSAFSFSFPPHTTHASTLSPVTPTTPSTPGYSASDLRFAPYKLSSWPRREMLRSVSPGSSSSLGSLSPAGSDSVDCESVASDKNPVSSGDVWRPW